MDPDPDPDRTRGELLPAGGGIERTLRRREGEELRVPLGVDLDPAVRDIGRPQGTPMLGEGFGVAIGAELVQEPGRAFHIREQEGDFSAR